jgi:hypothetical protein
MENTEPYISLSADEWSKRRIHIFREIEKRLGSVSGFVGYKTK